METKDVSESGYAPFSVQNKTLLSDLQDKMGYKIGCGHIMRSIWMTIEIGAL